MCAINVKVLPVSSTLGRNALEFYEGIRGLSSIVLVHDGVLVEATSTVNIRNH